jgi:hypothetical protein
MCRIKSTKEKKLSEQLVQGTRHAQVRVLRCGRHSELGHRYSGVDAILCHVMSVANSNGAFCLFQS